MKNYDAWTKPVLDTVYMLMPAINIIFNILMVIGILVLGMYLISKFFIWFTDYDRTMRRRNKRNPKLYKKKYAKTKRRG